jgi:hypothetical protein
MTKKSIDVFQKERWYVLARAEVARVARAATERSLFIGI